MKNQFLSDKGMTPHTQYKEEPRVMHFLHLHPQYEVYFCPRKTNQQLVLNGKEYVCDTPCVVISPPYSIHSMSSMTDEPYPRYCFYFTEQMLEHLREGQYVPLRLNNPEILFLELTEEEASLLIPVAQTAAQSAYGLTGKEKEIAFSLFLNMLFRICPEDRVHTYGNFRFYIQKVFRYIAENYMQDISSESVAKEFSISRSKLDRDLRTFADCTLHDFLDLCRLNRAKELLQSGERLAVEEIGRLCGFHNSSYFYIFFKKYMGVSPLEYRKQFLTAQIKKK